MHSTSIQICTVLNALHNNGTVRKRTPHRRPNDLLPSIGSRDCAGCSGWCHVGARRLNCNSLADTEARESSQNSPQLEALRESPHNVRPPGTAGLDLVHPPPRRQSPRGSWHHRGAKGRKLPIETEVHARSPAINVALATKAMTSQ